MRVLLTIFLLACVSIAHAETAFTQNEADQQFEKAKDTFIKGDYEKSLEILKTVFQFYEEKADRQKMADILYWIGRDYRRLSKFPDALEQLNRAQRLHEEIGDQQGIGFDVTEIAITFQRQGNYDDAFKLSEKALAIHQATGNQEGLARTYDNFGNICFRRAEYSKAIEYFQQAEAAANRNGNGQLLSVILNNLAQVYWNQGDYPVALETYERSRKLVAETGDLPLLAIIISNEALVYEDQGELMRALEAIDQTNVIFRQTGSQQDVAANYLNSGSIQLALGNHQKAQEAFQEALTLAQQLKDNGLMAVVLNAMANLSRDLGNYDSALEYARRARTLSQKTGELRSSIYSLSVIGLIYENQQNYPAALQNYRKSLQLFEKIGDKISIAENLLHVAAVESHLKQYDRALANGKQALTIYESMSAKSGIGQSYMMIGSAFRKLARLEEADEALTKSIGNLRDVGMPELLWAALYQKGLVARDRGNMPEAIQSMKESIDAIEQIRGQVALTEQKWGYFENKLDVYEDLVNLLIQSGQTAEAFGYVQRAKGRSFLDMLSEARIDPKADLDPELYHRKVTTLAALMNTNKKIREQYESDNPDTAEIERLIKARDQWNEKYLDLIIEIRKQNPRYANLQHPQPLNLSDAQSLLNDETVILDYFASKTQAVVFAITNSGVKVIRLPSIGQLNSQVQDLMESIQRPDPVDQLSADAYSRYKKNASLLYRELILAAEPVLKNKKLILIAPDGALNHLPFESLLTKEVPADQNDFSVFPYLTLAHQIQYIPSISGLAALKASAAENTKDRNRRLIAFAPLAEGTLPASNGIQSDKIFREWSSSLTSLPYTKTEVEGISRLYTKDNATVLIGKKASEENVKSLPLDQYSIVHFASHGLIDEERPEFSALVLTPGGPGGEDGFLTMREVFDLKLKADLVVLSACKTALGHQIRGEGVAGIARAFFGAGASRLLVSLWNVNDRSTSDFMVDFYRGVYQSSFTAASALQQARLNMIRSKTYSHPYYWAPFVLVGIP